MTMTQEERYVFRELRAEDLGSWLETRRLCFPEDAVMDEEGFHRTHTLNPAGGRVLVGVQGEEVVSSYVAQPMRARLGTEDVYFCHVVDSMVHPEHRKGLKNPGLFVRTAQAFFDRFGDMDAVHYGWPVERAQRVGRRFLEYKVVREELALVRDLSGSSGESAEGVIELTEAGPEVFALWERCAERWEASAVRDADYLRWRFLEHPRKRYAVLAAPAADGSLAGLCVVGEDELHVEGARPLVDWLVPAGEGDVAARLEAAAPPRGRGPRRAPPRAPPPPPRAAGRGVQGPGGRGE
ncbi:MAG: GNAT family N-acetyltransferase, partial [Planctomycetes bacterium]|nr:GNAT family N-acetyltransferase [Planctomycetota bacterium]